MVRHTAAAAATTKKNISVSISSLATIEWTLNKNKTAFTQLNGGERTRGIKKAGGRERKANKKTPANVFDSKIDFSVMYEESSKPANMSKPKTNTYTQTVFFSNYYCYYYYYQHNIGGFVAIGYMCTFQNFFITHIPPILLHHRLVHVPSFRIRTLKLSFSRHRKSYIDEGKTEKKRQQVSVSGAAKYDFVYI